MNISEIVEEIKKFEPTEPDIPIGDFHSVNTKSIFGDEYIKAIKGDEAKANKMRKRGKRDGLAILYGGTEYTLSKDGDVSMEEAVEVIENFYKNLPTLKSVHSHQKSHAKKFGYVKNFFGGIRYLPFAMLKKPPEGMPWKQFASIRSKAERLALNAPVQSSSADQILLIIGAISRWIEKNRLNRLHGNLMNTYKPYTRVVGLPIEEWDYSFEEKLNSLDDGIVKFIVFDGDTAVMEYERNVSMHKDFIKENNIRIVW